MYILNNNFFNNNRAYRAEIELLRGKLASLESESSIDDVRNEWRKKIQLNYCSEEEKKMKQEEEMKDLKSIEMVAELERYVLGLGLFKALSRRSRNDCDTVDRSPNINMNKIGKLPLLFDNFFNLIVSFKNSFIYLFIFLLYFYLKINFHFL